MSRDEPRSVGTTADPLSGVDFSCFSARATALQQGDTLDEDD